MSDHIPAAIYKEQLSQLTIQLSQLQQNKSLFAWARLISFVSVIAAIWILSGDGWLPAIAVSILFLALFIYFVSKDLANSSAIDNVKLLITINENELSALAHQVSHFPDGSEWMPPIHTYAGDLDILGKASLYQYSNRTTSQQGNQLFANWLLAPASLQETGKRQEAVKELAPQLKWRQQLQAHGQSKQLTIRTQENISSWLDEENKFINNAGWKIVRILFPLLSFTVLGLYLAAIIDQNRFLPLMLLFLSISFLISKKITPAYARLNRITAELETLSESIGCIEHNTFKASLLQELKNVYQSKEGTASGRINQLKKILNRLDYRLNPIVFIPLSAFLCWDLQQVLSLEKWKKKNQQNIHDWFSSLAEIEALSSLANLSFNHPQWCYPVFVNNQETLSAESLGHPLIPEEKRIDNTFSTEGSGQLSLITGSNMAGKSTFLRSVGVNIVLAMTGSPVCAQRFSLSPVRVMSSMRISDNLEESTSTFYAELKKLKEIIEEVYKNEKVFLLLDEILRGTNSADRHTGSTALLKQLVRHNAVGIVATHDLELAKLADEFPGNVHNYHFDVQVANEELFFDYKLKKGICQSMNASILMKKIGIEL